MFWSDNEAEKDLLRFGYLARAATSIIDSPHLRPTTIGVFGDWGSGKSTLLKMIDQQLASNKGILRVHFNGWLFEGYDDTKAALMGTILDAIEDRAKTDETILEKIAGTLTTLRQRVNWLQLLSLGSRFGLFTALGGAKGGAVALASAGYEAVAKALSETDKDKRLSGEDVAKIIKEAPVKPDELRRSIREFRRDFAALLKDSKVEVLVVFIDDLDRCLPSTIIETLEAIRLFLYVEGTVFVLGADERLVEYAVRTRFPELPGTRAEVGRDYLEKLVQFPLRIPPLSGAELHAYTNLLFAQQRLTSEDFGNACGHVDGFAPTNIDDLSFGLAAARDLFAGSDDLVGLEEDLDFVSQIVDIMAPGMQGNPRRTKRFLNMLLLRLALGEARGLALQRPTLAKVMLLEYIRPEFFRQLAALQAAQTGRPKELALLEQAVRPPAPPKSPAEGDGAAAKGAQEAKGAAKATPPTAPASEISANLPTEAQAWFADDWVHGWLLMEPRLADTDLRPYFCVAHDKAGASDVGQARLSRAAAEVLNRLLDDQPVTYKLALKDAGTLNTADLTAVFDDLARRVRQAPSLGESTLQKKVFELATTRPELVPQLITLYGALPITKIILATPTLIYQVANGSASADAARSLLGKWEASAPTALARAAKQALNRPWGSA